MEYNWIYLPCKNYICLDIWDEILLTVYCQSCYIFTISLIIVLNFVHQKMRDESPRVGRPRKGTQRKSRERPER